MFVSGYEMPLVEILMTLCIIIVIILIEVIAVLSLLIYYRRSGRHPALEQPKKFSSKDEELTYLKNKLYEIKKRLSSLSSK